jgi:hypothetical protein
MTEDDDEISGKFVLVVSDMHVGSAYGLLPEGFVGSTGVELNLNLAGISLGMLEALYPGRAAKDRRAGRQW